MLDFGKEAIDILSQIAVFGKDPEGGETRLLYTTSWLDAQKYLKKIFEDANFISRFDDIGNLFGKIEGSKYRDETIMSGSHIDTVKNGGMYDGQYGVVAAYIATKYLKDKFGAPLRNIEIVSFAEEEGSRFPYTFWGSKNFCEIAKKEDVVNIADPEGVLFVDAMKACGFNFRDENVKFRKDIKSFVEIHIEQGKVLEIEKVDIGVVNAIVGQRRFNVEITGEANHAGTTPMGYRKDAVYAMSKMVSYIIDKAKEYGDPLVATVGEILVKPNTVNVIPGYVLFTLDARHTDMEILKKFTEEVTIELKKIAGNTKTQISIDMWMDAEPVKMDNNVVSLLEEVCKISNTGYKLMHSGAGHDSQIVAKLVPTAMLFVPSHLGISHNPDEFTGVKNLATGISVLADAIYKMAYID